MRKQQILVVERLLIARTPRAWGWCTMTSSRPPNSHPQSPPPSSLFVHRALRRNSAALCYRRALRLNVAASTKHALQKRASRLLPTPNFSAWLSRQDGRCVGRHTAGERPSRLFHTTPSCPRSELQADQRTLSHIHIGWLKSCARKSRSAQWRAPSCIATTTLARR